MNSPKGATYNHLSGTQRYRFFYGALVLGLAILLTGCKPDRKVTRAFYYWQTVFQMGEEETALLDEIGIDKLYLRAFDIEWNDPLQSIKFVAPVLLLNPLPIDKRIVPVVFIENEVFRKTNPEQRNEIAQAVLEKLAIYLKSVPYTELQIDCDWTTGTREAYFAFLDSIHRQAPHLQLSSTIRLHQVRDTESSGFPPVDRGMLMAYNLQSPADPNAENSILQMDMLRGYVKKMQEYPIPLDIALPLFSWGIVRDEKQFKGLIDNLREVDLEGANDFKKIGEHTWEARKNTYIHSQYIRQGEEIKVESVSMAELKKAAKLLDRKSNVDGPSGFGDSLSVSFFHFAPEVIRNYPKNELESVYETFR